VYMTANPKNPTEQVSPTELADGDVVLDGELCLRIIGEPQTMHTGLGLFDEFQLMIRTEVEDSEDGSRSARIWSLDAVLIRRARPEADDGP
jgi:hypothetical protein